MTQPRLDRLQRARHQERYAPLGGKLPMWLRLGSALCGNDLFTRDYGHNPLVAYSSGRRGFMGLIEGMLTLAPWFVLFAAEVAGIFWIASTGSIDVLLGLFFLESLLLPSYVALVCALQSSVAVSRVLTKLPADELRLTSLDSEEILQGVALRPIAAMQAVFMIATLALMVIVGFHTFAHGRIRFQFVGGFDDLTAGVVMIALLAVRWQIVTACATLGGILGTRAALMLRYAPSHIPRLLVDWFFSLPPWVLIVQVLVAAGCFGFNAPLFVLGVYVAGYVYADQVICASARDLVQRVAARREFWRHHREAHDEVRLSAWQPWYFNEKRLRDATTLSLAKSWVAQVRHDAGVDRGAG